MDSGTTVPPARTPKIVFLQPFVDHTGGTTYSGIDRDSPDRAIQGAGTALHTGVEIGKQDFLPVRCKNLVRADFQTSTTTDAGWSIQFQCGYIFQIAKVFHFRNLPASSRIVLRINAPPIVGRATSISFLTPERDV